MDDIVLNLIPQDGTTALHLASQYGHADIAQLLIVAHAQLNLQDKVLCTCDLSAIY